jgi:type I restriction enzyme S subunit/type I restriction enzyme M protein
MVKDAYSKREQADSLYREAETLLLRELGLADFKPSNDNISIKTLKQSFLSTGRLDSEYYQKKYEDYVQLIKKYRSGYELLYKVCVLKDDEFMPNSKIEYDYIELADIGNSGNITGCTTGCGVDLPTRARRRVNTNDVIVSSIEGSLQSCALIPREYDDSLCSTGFYVIHSPKINSETLLVLFKSEVMQNILKQNCSGTILTAINKVYFKRIPIPLIPAEAQRQIAGLIQKSFALRKKSEQLLEESKIAVEAEIEG